MARTEEERALGYIPVQCGDEVRRLPVLKIVDDAAWKAAFNKAWTGDTLKELRPGRTDMAGFMAADQLGSKVMLDLVIAYDKTKVLGGRKEIERLFDADQLQALYEKLVEVTFRFASSVTATQLAMMVYLTSQAGAPLGGANSASSQPPNGDSGPIASPPN